MKIAHFYSCESAQAHLHNTLGSAQQAPPSYPLLEVGKAGAPTLIHGNHAPPHWPLHSSSLTERQGPSLVSACAV